MQPVGDSLRRGQGGNIGHDRAIAEGPFRAEEVGVPNRERVTRLRSGHWRAGVAGRFRDADRDRQLGESRDGWQRRLPGQRVRPVLRVRRRNGRQLLTFKAPRAIRASPLTYKVNGRQYVTVVATNTVLALGLP